LQVFLIYINCRRAEFIQPTVCVLMTGSDEMLAVEYPIKRRAQVNSTLPRC